VSKSTSFRLPAPTRAKLTWLADAFHNGNQTAALIATIDRAYTAERSIMTENHLPADPTDRVEALERLAEDAYYSNSRAYSLGQATAAGMTPDAYLDWLTSEAAMDVETRRPRITDAYDLKIIRNAMEYLVNRR
jgi:hypothetical protein